MSHPVPVAERYSCLRKSVNKATWRFIPLLVFCFLIPLISCADRDGVSRAPRAEGGIIDLRGRDLNRHTCTLNGEWEFYWDELLTPADISLRSVGTDELYSVPGIWNADHDGKSYPRYGYATYRLTVLLDPSVSDLAIGMREVLTSYRIWVDGEIMFSSGVVGRDRGSSRPGIVPHVTSVADDDGRLEIVLQVANFDYKDGGIRDPLILGSASRMVRHREISLVMHYALFGALLVMAIYHFGLFSLNRGDTSTLFFGIFCLVIATRVLVTDEIFIVHLIANIGWEVQTKIIVLGYYVAFPVFVVFIYKLFPREISRRFLRWFVVFGTVASLFVLFSPARIYTHTEVAYQIIVLLVSVYLLTSIIRAAVKKREGATLIIFGGSALLISVVNDIVYAQYMAATAQSLIPFGMLVFVLIQSYILSIRFSRAYTHANHDDLTGVLNRRGFSELLEQEVTRAERTKEIMCMLSLDIDYFKTVNDTYGHEAGDRVLQSMADLVTHHIRRIDIFGRMGGEEFALVLPETSREKAVRTAERIRQLIEEMDIPVRSDRIRITVSIGVAELRDASLSAVDGMFVRADRALYLAKESGRNRVVCRHEE